MSQSMEAGPTWHFPAPGGDCPSCGFRNEEKISLGPDHAGPKGQERSLYFVHQRKDQSDSACKHQKPTLANFKSRAYWKDTRTNRKPGESGLETLENKVASKG